MTAWHEELIDGFYETIRLTNLTFHRTIAIRVNTIYGSEKLPEPTFTV